MNNNPDSKTKPGGFRATIGSAAATTASFIALIWGVHIINVLSNYYLVGFGIIPHKLSSLPEIFTAPFIHGSTAHIINNTFTSAVLLFLVALSGAATTLTATFIIIVIGGLGVWFTGSSYQVHVGASLLIYGWLAFLVLRGIFTRRFLHILLGVLLALYYSSSLLGFLPQQGISWQGHLFGAIGGALAAWMLSPKTERNTKKSTSWHT